MKSRIVRSLETENLPLYMLPHIRYREWRRRCKYSSIFIRFFIISGDFCLARRYKIGGCLSDINLELGKGCTVVLNHFARLRAPPNMQIDIVTERRNEL